MRVRMEAWEKTIKAAAYGGHLLRTRHPLGGMPRVKHYKFLAGARVGVGLAEEAMAVSVEALVEWPK